LKFRSVVSRIIALHLVAIVVTSICMPLALYMIPNYAAQELHHRALRELAAEILRYLDRGPDGVPRLSLPAALAQFYSEAYGRSAYAVLDPDGRVLFSSVAGDRAITRARPQTKPFEYFALHREGADIFGVTVTADVGGQPLMLQVSEDLGHRDVLIDDIVAEFFTRVGLRPFC
jgi:Two-component sensor kinase N-terminal